MPAMIMVTIKDWPLEKCRKGKSFLPKQFLNPNLRLNLRKEAVLKLWWAQYYNNDSIKTRLYSVKSILKCSQVLSKKKNYNTTHYLKKVGRISCSCNCVPAELKCLKPSPYFLPMYMQY